MKKVFLSTIVVFLSYYSVQAQCHVDFSATAEDCSDPLTVRYSFTGTEPNGATTYVWDFGTGATPANSAAQNPPLVSYAGAGAVTVTLTVTDFGFGANCAGGQTTTKTINIAPTPNATFTPPAAVCVGATMDFTNGSANPGQNISGYSWDFGEGATPRTSTAEDPSGIIYSTSGTKSVTLNVTNSLGCTGTSTQNVTIDETPSASFISSAANCTDDLIDFTNTGTIAGVTYAWDFGTGATPANSTNQDETGVLYTTPGSKIITLTTTNTTTGCSDVATQSINISQTPTVSFTHTAPQCVDVGVDYTNTGSTGNTTLGYSWDFGDNAATPVSTSENPTGISYTTSGTKTITFRITSAEGCTESTTQTITIDATPTSDFASTAPQCTNAPVDFISTGTNTGVSFAWNFGTGAAPATSIGQDQAGVIYSTAGSKTVSLTLTNTTTGCTDVETKLINIYETPIVTFTNTAPQCVNTDIDFTNTGTTGNTLTFGWDFGDDASPALSTTENPVGVSYTSSGNKTVRLQITSEYGCTDSDVQTISINNIPVANAGIDTTICANTTADLGVAAVGGNTYSWVSASTLDNGAIANPTASPIASITKYALTVTTTATGCTAVDSVEVTMLDPLNADAGEDVIICEGETVQIGSSLIQGQDYVWTTATGLSSTTISNPYANPIVTTTYTLSVTGYGCGPETDEVQVTVLELPRIIINHNAPKCVGSPINFSNLGVNTSTLGFEYLWDFKVGANPQESVSEGPNITYTTAGPKTVSLKITNQGRCPQVDTETINIDPLPNGIAGVDTTICANTSVQLGGASSGGDIYSWFPTSTLNTANIATPTASPVSPVTEYILTLTDTTTLCVNFDTINVTMLAPLIADAGIDVTICRYDSVQLGAGLIEGQVYDWTVVSGLDSASLSNPMSSPDSTRTYLLTVTGNFLTTGVSCPAETDEVTVIVNQLPLANAGLDDTITVGSSIQLVATGGVQYAWLPIYGLDNPGINDPIASPELTTEYEVEVKDIYGCINYDTVLITVLKPEFWVPNAFTPNGDGKSDVFFVRGSGFVEFEFGVINRWGEQLFVTEDIHTGWDGNRAITGAELPAGAYIYYIRGKKSDGEMIDTKGMINLIR